MTARARLFASIYGVAVLFWLSLEDNSVLPVTLIGTGFALLLLALWLRNAWGGRRFGVRVWFPALVICGGAAGGLAALTVAALMFFKTGWHAHIYPDYPPQMILAMLERIPAWSASGALIGLAMALMLYARQSKPSGKA